MKFPFTVYRINRWTQNRNVELPRSPRICEFCNSHSDHTGPDGHTTEKVIRISIHEFKVVGSNDEEYFIAEEYGDICTIPKEGCFFTETEAEQAAKERLDEKA